MTCDGPPPVLSVLMPVRNEALNLKVMLRILRPALADLRHEVLVVFTDPADTSIPVIEAARRDNPVVIPVHCTSGTGVASALRAGVAAARGERVLVFLADDLGPVLAIDDIMGLMDEGVEFVSCTRYAYGGRRLGGSRIGHVLSRLANSLLRYLSSAAFTDSTTGVKCFLKKDFARLTRDTDSIGWAVAFEMAINAQAQGLRLGEIPVISIDRLFGGQSSFRLFPWIAGYLRYFILALKRLPRGGRPPVKVRIPINCDHGSRVSLSC